MPRRDEKKEREPARPRDRDAVEGRAPVQPGFTSSGSSGSEGGRALYGEAPEDVEGPPPTRGRDEKPVGWQGTVPDWPQHKGRIATKDDLPPRAARDAPERKQPREGATAVSDALWEKHGERQDTALKKARDEPPVE